MSFVSIVWRLHLFDIAIDPRNGITTQEGFLCAVAVLVESEGERHCSGRPSVLLMDICVIKLSQTKAGHGGRG